MSAKDTKSDVFSYFKNGKGEFLVGRRTISLNNGLLNTFTFVLMQMCACLKAYMREVIDYVFCVLCMVCPGSAVSRNCQDKACNESKTLGQLGLVCVLNSPTQM